jgi:hypothetical protein
MEWEDGAKQGGRGREREGQVDGGWRGQILSQIGVYVMQLGNDPTLESKDAAGPA